MKQKKTLILYGDWLLKKMYYRNNFMVCGVHGQEKCGAYIGFLNTIKNAVDFLNPDKVIVVWDGVRDGWYKYDSYPDLKLEKKEKWSLNDYVINNSFYTNAKQEDSACIWDQKIFIQEALDDLCVRQGEETYSEAYDVIAHYTIKAQQEGEKVFLFGREYDYFQLISDQVYNIIDGKDYVISVHNFQELYGYDLDNELMLKSFTGANSSVARNIKGVTRNKLLKYFPELSKSKVTHNNLIKIIEEKLNKKKLKLFDSILDSFEDLKANSKVLNMREPYVNVDVENIVEELLYSQMCVDVRNISLISKNIKDRGMAIHIDDDLEDFFSTFERLKLKEMEYTKQVAESQ